MPKASKSTSGSRAARSKPMETLKKVESASSPSPTGLSARRELLSTRDDTHGNFNASAAVSQSLKRIMKGTLWWSTLPDSHKEALDMICLKVSRILAGHSNYTDHWADIAGYAQLVVDDLTGAKTLENYLAEGNKSRQHVSGHQGGVDEVGHEQKGRSSQGRTHSTGQDGNGSSHRPPSKAQIAQWSRQRVKS